MQMKCSQLLILLTCIQLTIGTQITLPNWNFKYDSLGNVLDVHDGKLYYFERKFYFYGTAYNCGFRWRTCRQPIANYTSPFCGFKCYSSTDLKVWFDEGYLFDASTHEWQSRCSVDGACFRPKVLHNPHTHEYILWINTGASKYGYAVFTSENPVGPWNEVESPVMARERGGGDFGNGDFGIVIGPTGKGYIAYDNAPAVTAPAVPGHSVFQNPNITYGIVQELNDDYTGVTENYVVTGLANIEAWDMFYRDGWWYLTFSHICGYCTQTSTSYIKSKDPMGPWRDEDRVYFTNTSCGGQQTMVAQLPSGDINSSEPHVWLFGSDIWTGDVNEGKAGSHWEPLNFLEDGSISPLDCTAPEYLIDIPVSASNIVDVVANATISSSPGNYTWECGFGIQDRSILYQFFQASKSGNVTEVGVNIGQQSNNAPVTMALNHVYNISELFSPSGGVHSLWSQNFPVDTIGWSFPIVTGTPNVQVEEDEWYALELAATAVSIPYCYLQRETDYDTSNIFDPPKSFLAEIQLGKYPLYPLLDKEIRYYVQIADIDVDVKNN